MGLAFTRRYIVIMMASSMETFSKLLSLCAGNSPVTGELLSQRSVTQSFDVFYLHLHKRWNKQSWGWWFETPSRSLWRQCNDHMMIPTGTSMHLKRHRPMSIGIPIINLKWCEDRLRFIIIWIPVINKTMPSLWIEVLDTYWQLSRDVL